MDQDIRQLERNYEVICAAAWTDVVLSPVFLLWLWLILVQISKKRMGGSSNPVWLQAWKSQMHNCDHYELSNTVVSVGVMDHNDCVVLSSVHLCVSCCQL